MATSIYLHGSIPRSNSTTDLFDASIPGSTYSRRRKFDGWPSQLFAYALRGSSSSASSIRSGISIGTSKSYHSPIPPAVPKRLTPYQLQRKQMKNSFQFPNGENFTPKNRHIPKSSSSTQLATPIMSRQTPMQASPPKSHSLTGIRNNSNSCGIPRSQSLTSLPLQSSKLAPENGPIGFRSPSYSSSKLTNSGSDESIRVNTRTDHVQNKPSAINTFATINKRDEEGAPSFKSLSTAESFDSPRTSLASDEDFHSARSSLINEEPTLLEKQESAPRLEPGAALQVKLEPEVELQVGLELDDSTKNESIENKNLENESYRDEYTRPVETAHVHDEQNEYSRKFPGNSAYDAYDEREEYSTEFPRKSAYDESGEYGAKLSGKTAYAEFEEYNTKLPEKSDYDERDEYSTNRSEVSSYDPGLEESFLKPVLDHFSPLSTSNTNVSVKSRFGKLFRKILHNSTPSGLRKRKRNQTSNSSHSSSPVITPPPKVRLLRGAADEESLLTTKGSNMELRSLDSTSPPRRQQVPKRNPLHNTGNKPCHPPLTPSLGMADDVLMDTDLVFDSLLLKADSSRLSSLDNQYDLQSRLHSVASLEKPLDQGGSSVRAEDGDLDTADFNVDYELVEEFSKLGEYIERTSNDQITTIDTDTSSITTLPPRRSSKRPNLPSKYLAQSFYRHYDSNSKLIRRLQENWDNVHFDDVPSMTATNNSSSGEKNLRFAPDIYVRDTWSSGEYFRSDRLFILERRRMMQVESGGFINSIKKELNEYKRDEMTVHIDSAKFTHFFI